MRYCSRCVYPEIAVNTLFDDEGVCGACRVQEEFDQLSDEFWVGRREKFEEIIGEARDDSGSRYDCVIAVSGGKDSYWQTHVIKNVYGLNPLLVTYHGNNYLPEGQRNLDRMRDVFDVDHIVVGPGVETLRKLNRLCFRKMGDMNWHAHCGIKTVPIQVAVRYEVPLIIWGEVTWSIAGMFSPDDYVEFSKRTRLEHDMRGFDWFDMVEETEQITERDMLWARYPSDENIDRIGLRGIYIGNFFNWDPNEHSEKMRAEHGFEYSERPFERTYRRMSNLDDMHENGIHDYMKFVKFGYGRASDHASKDIRTGYMSREEGIEMVRTYDHVKPRRDLERWLDYVGFSEQEFDETADSFRDPRVWRKQDGAWVKDNIWDEVPASDAQS